MTRKKKLLTFSSLLLPLNQKIIKNISEFSNMNAWCWSSIVDVFFLYLWNSAMQICKMSSRRLHVHNYDKEYNIFKLLIDAWLERKQFHIHVENRKKNISKISIISFPTLSNFYQHSFTQTMGFRGRQIYIFTQLSLFNMCAGKWAAIWLITCLQPLHY